MAATGATTTQGTIDVVTPAAGESVSEGTILEWRVQVGDFIALNDTIVEISTDKVDVELPSPASGTVVEILAQEGDTVGVGQVIARLSTGEDGAQGTPAEADGEASEATRGGAGTDTAPAGASADTAPAGTSTSTAPSGASTQAPAPAPEDANVSPVAARVAAAEGVDLAGVSGSGPSGRIVKEDVLAAAADGTRNGAGAGAGASASAPASAPTTAPASAARDGAGQAQAQQAERAQRTPLKGAAAALARYMEESRAIPTATSFRTLTVTVLAGRRAELKAGGRRVSFTHLIAYALARAAAGMPVMTDHYAELDGRGHRVRDGEVNLGIAVDVERRDGSRTLLVPVIRDAAALPFEDFLAGYDALVGKARGGGLSPDDLVGANITLTNPGGLGTVASVPRLMPGQGTIVATGSIAYPVGLERIGAAIGAEKVLTMTSTYDHRVIQGAESGRFLALIEEHLQGEHEFYERVFASLGVALGPAPAPPTPQAPAVAPAAAAATAAVAPDEQLLQAAVSGSVLLGRFRSHGHLAAHLDPLGSEPEGTTQVDPGEAGLTEELMARVPAKILNMYVPGDTLAEALPYLRQTYCGTIAYEVEHIASHRQRVWLREQIESGAFRRPLGAEECGMLLKRLIEVDALERFMHKAYLGQHQFSIEGVDMTVPMLDELIQLSSSEGAGEVVMGMA
ncbi:MAG: 2-oxo acid dehydrogenase subunit E2, partial [Solirubrobacterales bacterium]|nr:2-oxo acid dehydrogenase subunit E2 [Solirubrobacterales bacterium]